LSVAREIAVDTDQQVRPSAIWRRLAREKRLIAAEAFWRDSESAEQHAEAVDLIARHMKFRPQSVRALPLERRSRYLVGLPHPSELVVARMLVAYHLATQRPMMSAFLDAVGIPHDDGLIAGDVESAPDPEAVARAARAVRAKFPDEDVQVYFDTLLAQDPDTWKGLAEAR
jgi:hypothetical protein